MVFSGVLVRWTAGRLDFNSGTFTNNGTLTTTTDNSMENFGGTNAFNNGSTGTFTKMTAVGTSTFNVPFNNDGTLNANSGTLNIRTAHVRTPVTDQSRMPAFALKKKKHHITPT